MNEWELTDREIEAIPVTNLGGNVDDLNMAKAAQKKLVEWILGEGEILLAGATSINLPSGSHNGGVFIILYPQQLKSLRRGVGLED